METTIWQTGAAMSFGLIGSFLLIALRGSNDQPPWYIACILGPFMSSVAFLWWLAAKRWWSVQHAMFFRMRHIEKRLGLHSMWYIQYLDHPELLPTAGLEESEIADLQERSSGKNQIGIRRHQHWGVQASLWLLPIVLLLAWIIYAFVLFVAQITQAT